MKRYLFCTLEDVKATLNTSAPDYSINDPRLMDCLIIASSIISKVIDRPWRYGTYVDLINTPRMNGSPFRVYTRCIPVEEGSMKAKFSPYRQFGDIDYLDESAFTVLDYEKGSASLQVNCGVAANSGLRIEYVGGWRIKDLGDDPPEIYENYEVFDTPPDIEHGTALQAAYLANRMLTKDTGSNKDNPYSMRRESPFVIPEVATLVLPYKTPKYRGV